MSEQYFGHPYGSEATVTDGCGLLEHMQGELGVSIEEVGGVASAEETGYILEE